MSSPTPVAAPSPTPSNVSIGATANTNMPMPQGASDYGQIMEQVRESLSAPTQGNTNQPGGPPPTPAPTPPPVVAPTPAPTPAPVVTQPTPTAADLIAATVEQRTRANAPRDYTGMTDAERHMFQGMNNEAYNHFRKLYDDHKNGSFDPARLQQLQAQLEEHQKFRYYEHPEAYRLSEEYAQSAQLANAIQQTAAFWEEQMEIAEAEPERDVNGQPKPRYIRDLVRNAQGGLMPSAPILYDPSHKRHIRAQLNKTAADLADTNREIADLQRQYRAQHATFENNIKSYHQEVFGKSEQLLKPYVEQELKHFPAFSHSNPFVRALTHAIAFIKLGAQENAQRATAQVTTTAVQAAAAAAGPGMSQLLPGQTQPAVTGSALEEKQFKEFQQQYQFG